MTAGPGDRSARCTPKRPIASGSRSAASCRCRRARSPGRRTACCSRRAATRPATATASAPRATPSRKRGWERRYHHVIFVVDRDGKMVQWWNDLDKIFEGKCGRGPHKIKMSPYDPEKHVWIIDDQLHVIYKFTYDGKLVMTLGHQGPARARRRQAVRPADRHRVAARRHLLHQRRLRRHARREVRQGRQVPDGLGHGAEGSEEPGTQRVQHRPQHPDQQRPAAVRRRSRPPAHPGVRRERQVPRHVQHGRELVAVRAPHHRPISPSGSPTAGRTAS